jgi:hypothetical protein
VDPQAFTLRPTLCTSAKGFIRKTNNFAQMTRFSKNDLLKSEPHHGERKTNAFLVPYTAYTESGR